MSSLHRAIIGLAWAIASATSLAAQQPARPANAQSLQQTRVELDSLRDRYQQLAASTAYSDAMRLQAGSELGRIVERLTQGDFRTGDRILLHVQGEAKIPDTLVVEPGPSVRIPLMGPISLAGILRSELEDHMSREVGRFIQNPIVEAQALIRVSMEGSVGRPGFYVLPASLLLGDAIMAAGGPGGNADLSKVQVKRGTQVVMQGAVLQEAIAEGRSLDQLNILAGDAVVVPLKRSGLWQRIGTYVVLTGSTLLVTILTRL